ncbi:MAG: hypothetical protein IJT21_11335 [Synergistaceae bacterium]|nr:hypothetical protein [Synergistaceae bacterium]
MKKFLVKFSFLAAYFIIIQVILPVLIDPFNVFHAFNIRDNGVTPNQNYIKMKYILANPEKFNGFIFGSSRVTALNPEKINNGGKVYNMTYPAGLPCEHLANIKTFLANNIKPAKIYMAFDSMSYTVSYSEHITKPLNCPYEYLRENPEHFYSLYLNAAVTFQSIGKIIKHSPVKNFADKFYNYGYEFDYNMTSNYDWDKAVPAMGDFNGEKFMDSTLKDIREIVKICRDNNIELVIFTNPMHYITYLASLERNYIYFLAELAKITDFYNFSGLNSITINNNNYLETSHYKAEIGDIIINIICNGESYPELESQGFGVKITRKNINNLLNLLESQAKNFITQKSKDI